ncbi:hypothetical protein BVG16_13445 [Paenibacillus selenitireducens]|uniref:Uncharacterized protein n=1 Tax=Paenibacillus selenitireducens TaxID=1324314 RepID=A0A1T2XCP0_9BACL|nr:hypothetical protein [Paenibacillus selenitireducens]OPA77456.1 hypothetical protein BVG16_13445 [Paenibacillus selenitireducens]
MLAEQLELFPRATKEDIEATRQLLDEYVACVNNVKVLEEDGIEKLDPEEKKTYDKSVYKINRLNRAVKLIVNQDIREIIKYRYIEGNGHSLTIQKYAKVMDVSTVNRKINKGIESIADSLIKW